MLSASFISSSKQERHLLLDALSHEVYITNIPQNVNEESLRGHLQSKHQGITRIMICRLQSNLSKSSRRGYVLFSTVEDAEQFCSSTVEYEGCLLDCKQAPMRLGVLQHSIVKATADCMLIVGEEMKDGKFACFHEEKNVILSLQYWKQKIFVLLGDRKRLTFRFSTLSEAMSVDINDQNGTVVLEMVVRTPPEIHKEQNKLDGTDTHSKEVWERFTDFTNGVIGLCYRYRFVATQNLDEWEKVVKLLGDFKLIKRKEMGIEYKTMTVEPLPKTGLSFHDQLMVESLLSSHILPDPRIGADRNKFEDFVSCLAGPHDTCWNFQVLRRMVIDQLRLNEPSEAFKSSLDLARTIDGSLNLDLPGHVWVHRVLITPTRMHIPAPELELTNRVLRDPRFSTDQFLRVTFVDENLRPTMSEERSPSVLARIRLFLEKGFEVAGRRFQFFGYSASQLRRTSCWFFSGEGNVWKTIQSLGNFNENHSIPKYAARIGQCFSSTYSTIPIDMGKDSKDYEHGPDIETKNKKYNFSDGHGQIPLHLAERVVVAIRSNSTFYLPKVPSAFQFRMAGYKGVVSIHLSAEKMLLRTSMAKFKSRQDVNTFEVIAVSHFVPVYLNRPAIALLSHGGVPDEVIIEKQESELALLTSMLESDEEAKNAVRSIGSQFDDGFVAEQMIEAGFSVLSEPFLRDLLSAFCVQRMRAIKTKANIWIPKGGCLIGVLDETLTLDEGQVFAQMNCPLTKQKIVIEGHVLVFKNPVTHPGDVRKLRAVNCLSLLHLEDVLVFPAKGKRPHMNEASGSDLDGDVYSIIYDPDIVERFKSSEPGQYEAPKPVITNPVTYKHLIDWFLRYTSENYLGLLGHSLLIHADLSAKGPNDPKCLDLVKLYSLAVDFAKTGVMEILPSWVRVRELPDFMGKKHKPSYRSEKLLGRLFRSVPEYEPVMRNQVISIDPDMVFDGHSEFLPEASQLKSAYDYQLLGILNQYGVTESEAVGGCAAKFKGEFGKHGDQQASLALSNQVSALKRKYSKLFNTGLESATLSTRYAKASAWYIATYQGAEESTLESRPHLISYCWVVWADCIALKAMVMATKLKPTESLL